jgi:hypothetical protein
MVWHVVMAFQNLGTFFDDSSFFQGCQIFLGPNIPKREIIPKDHKLPYQTAKSYTNLS